LREGTPKEGELMGTVGKSAYLGSHMEYGVALDGIEGEVFVIDGNVGRPIEPGSTVAVTIDPVGAAIIPASGDDSR
jgi:hypothetical protein